MTLFEARGIAQEQNLDILLVTGDSSPPVCKLINFGQFKYEQQKKDRRARKNSKAQVLKELKLSPKISEHDYQVRINSCLKFLKKSYNVKLAVQFKGRENARTEIGRDLLLRFLDDVKEYGVASSEISKGNRSLFVMICAK